MMGVSKFVATIVVLCVCLTAVSGNKLRYRFRATDEPEAMHTVSANYDVKNPSTRTALTGPTVVVSTTKSVSQHDKKPLQAAEPNKPPPKPEQMQTVSRTKKHRHSSQKDLSPADIPPPAQPEEEKEVEEIVEKHVEKEEKEEETSGEEGEDEEAPSEEKVKGDLKHVHKRVKNLLDKVQSNAKDIERIKEAVSTEEEEEQEPDEAQMEEEEVAPEAEESASEEEAAAPEEEEAAPEEAAAPEEEEAAPEEEEEAAMEEEAAPEEEEVAPEEVLEPAE